MRQIQITTKICWAYMTAGSQAYLVAYYLQKQHCSVLGAADTKAVPSTAVDADACLLARVALCGSFASKQTIVSDVCCCMFSGLSVA
jgi:hypothetical protein